MTELVKFRETRDIRHLQELCSRPLSPNKVQEAVSVVVKLKDKESALWCLAKLIRMGIQDSLGEVKRFLKNTHEFRAAWSTCLMELLELKMLDKEFALTMLLKALECDFFGRIHLIQPLSMCINKVDVFQSRNVRIGLFEAITEALIHKNLCFNTTFLWFLENLNSTKFQNLDLEEKYVFTMQMVYVFRSFVKTMSEVKIIEFSELLIKSLSNQEYILCFLYGILEKVCVCLGSQCRILELEKLEISSSYLVQMSYLKLIKSYILRCPKLFCVFFEKCFVMEISYARLLSLLMNLTKKLQMYVPSKCVVRAFSFATSLLKKNQELGWIIILGCCSCTNIYDKQIMVLANQEVNVHVLQTLIVLHQHNVDISQVWKQCYQKRINNDLFKQYLLETASLLNLNDLDLLKLCSDCFLDKRTNLPMDVWNPEKLQKQKSIMDYEKHKKLEKFPTQLNLLSLFDLQKTVPSMLYPSDPKVGVVNAAVNLYGALFPRIQSEQQEFLLDAMHHTLKTNYFNFLFAINIAVHQLTSLPVKAAKNLVECISLGLESKDISVVLLTSKVIARASVLGNMHSAICCFLEKQPKLQCGIALACVEINTRQKTKAKEYLLEFNNEWSRIALILLMQYKLIELDSLILTQNNLFLGKLLQTFIVEHGPEVTKYPQIPIILKTLLKGNKYEQAEGHAALYDYLLVTQETWEPNINAVFDHHKTLSNNALMCLVLQIQRNQKISLEKSLIRIKHRSELVSRALMTLVENSTGASLWIDLCLFFLNPIVEDNEDKIQESQVIREHTRWSSQQEAIRCLRLFIKSSQKSSFQKCHTDVSTARRLKGDWLVLRISDIIRVAFKASTLDSIEVREEGLKLLEDVLDVFSYVPDPDYEGHLLLEQYQAQFSSALNTAFDVDLGALACRACARFISKDMFSVKSTIQHLQKLLELKPTCGQEIMLQCAALSCWAKLNLNEFVIGPLWLDVCFEYCISLFEMQTMKLKAKYPRLEYNLLLIYEQYMPAIVLASCQLDLYPYGVCLKKPKLAFMLLNLCFKNLILFPSTNVEYLDACAKLINLIQMENLLSDFLNVCFKIIQIDSIHLQKRVFPNILEILRNPITKAQASLIVELITICAAPLFPHLFTQKTDIFKGTKKERMDVFKPGLQALEVICTFYPEYSMLLYQFYHESILLFDVDIIRIRNDESSLMFLNLLLQTNQKKVFRLLTKIIHLNPFVFPIIINKYVEKMIKLAMFEESIILVTLNSPASVYFHKLMLPHIKNDAQMLQKFIDYCPDEKIKKLQLDILSKLDVCE